MKRVPVHLRVFERHGPTKFERPACQGRRGSLTEFKMTDDARTVDCGKCWRTRLFREALEQTFEEPK